MTKGEQKHTSHSLGFADRNLGFQVKALEELPNGQSRPVASYLLLVPAQWVCCRSGVEGKLKDNYLFGALIIRESFGVFGSLLLSV